MSEEITKITDEQLSNARLIAGDMTLPKIRKQGMIDILAINCAIDYLYSKNVNIDTRRSLYKIPMLYEEFKLTDIYYGNYRIDVISIYRDNKIKIPKIHQNFDIMPNFYFVVHIGKRLREAKMLGFIDKDTVLSSDSDTKYIYPSMDSVMSVRDFLRETKTPIPSKLLAGKHIDCMSLFLKFVDDDLPSDYKKQLVQHLLSCESCTRALSDLIEFEHIAGNIRLYPSLIRRYEQIVSNDDIEPEEDQLDKTFESSINSIPLDKVNKDESKILLPEHSTSIVLDDVESGVDSTKLIDNMFGEVPRIEFSAVRNLIGKKDKNRLLIITIALIVFVIFSIVSIKLIANSTSQRNLDNEEEYGQDINFFDDDYDTNHKARLISTKNPNLNDFIADGATAQKPVYTPTVSKISWEAPQSMVKNADYTKFLQLAGKNVKLNLQNELLLVNDIPTNKIVKIDIKFNSSGDVSSAKIIQSSGSEMIDNSIEKVVNDTLKYMKPPTVGLFSKSVNITLSLLLN